MVHSHQQPPYQRHIPRSQVVRKGQGPRGDEGWAEGRGAVLVGEGAAVEDDVEDEEVGAVD